MKTIILNADFRFNRKCSYKAQTPDTDVVDFRVLAQDDDSIYILIPELFPDFEKYLTSLSEDEIINQNFDEKYEEGVIIWNRSEDGNGFETIFGDEVQIWVQS